MTEPSRRNGRHSIFAKKTVADFKAEMEGGENRLRRILGPISLTGLGIGAIIGAGIFVMTGLAAHDYAGPGLMMSFIVAGLGCTFAAFCYAEFASMLPVAGSAYTYAYATMGELMAWIIGWDLILEYSMASSAVAVGWSGYLLKFLSLFHMHLPIWLVNDYWTAQAIIAHPLAAAQKLLALGLAQADIDRLATLSGIHNVDAVVLALKDSGQAMAALVSSKADIVDTARLIQDYASAQHHLASFSSKTIPMLGSVPICLNLPAFAIIGVITAILVKGIRESATFNATMVFVKLAVVLFVIAVGSFYVDVRNWSPFLPFGFKGVMQGAAYVFFAYIGFDSVSTHAEEAVNPKRDVPIGIITSLTICTLLYIAVSAVLTGMERYNQIDITAPIASAFASRGLNVAVFIISVAAIAGITSVLLVMLLSQPRVFLAMARDGLLPRETFGVVHPRFRTPYRSTMLTGVIVGLIAAFTPIEKIAQLVNIGTLLAFVIVCAAVWIMRKTNPEMPRGFRCPGVPLVPILGMAFNLALMFSLGWLNWLRLFVWLGLGLLIYFTYGRKHSLLALQANGHSKKTARIPSQV